MSNNRYSSLNQRSGATSGSSLFADYGRGKGNSRPSSSTSQHNNGNSGNLSGRPYAYPSSSTGDQFGARSASPYYSSTPNTFHNGNTDDAASESPRFKPSKGNPYHSTAVLEELESQNETTQTSLLSSKVSQLKQLTIAIGDEIRDSSTLASQINDQFEGTTVRLKGTMRRMLRMAERTGVGWRVWVLFFIAVWAIFAWVWLS